MFTNPPQLVAPIPHDSFTNNAQPCHQPCTGGALTYAPECNASLVQPYWSAWLVKLFSAQTPQRCLQYASQCDDSIYDDIQAATYFSSSCAVTVPGAQHAAATAHRLPPLRSSCNHHMCSPPLTRCLPHPCLPGKSSQLHCTTNRDHSHPVLHTQAGPDCMSCLQLWRRRSEFDFWSLFVDVEWH